MPSRFPSFLYRARYLLMFGAYIAIALAAQWFMDRPDEALQEIVTAARQDADLNKLAFERNCIACHTVGVNNLGPKLDGLMGRRAGTVANFQYSAAMRQRGIAWNDETLRSFLRNPSEYIPGTAMALGPIDDETITRVLRHLRTLQ